MAASDSLFEVRRSSVHGLGVFATRAIAKGTRIIEYLGERVSHAEADRRYETKDENDSHTFLFIVDSRTVIDAGVDGNDARYINHSCDPNCESVVEGRRVYIEAIRTIEPGTELTYDYQIQREDDDPPNIDEVFACRCGFAQCRGTMLWPTERKPARGKSPKRPARKRHAGKGSRQRADGKRARDKGARGKRVAERSHEGGRSARNARDRRSAAGRGRAARRRAGKNKKGGRRG
ncbi:MAG TPA: SET domain-containing protein-lysine N-methyltransferase [Steroidobacteraceae bacterium]|nr:SET domain-containing protein-lysine N-methyltransferase [Steroidobacteraceae bacterium]